MRCSAYCSASSYNIQRLVDQLNSFSPILIHEGSYHLKDEASDIFLFAFGVVIFWHVSESQEKKFLNQIRPYEHESLAIMESDYFSFEYGKSPNMHQDHICLNSEQDFLEKFTISQGLAQSIKLASFESRIEKVIGEVKEITDALVQKGIVPLSQRQISRKIGLLFSERSSINLHSDFLNPPDFFWDNPELEPLYQMVAKDVTIRSRTQTLNRKLDIMHDLYQILSDTLNHRHSTKLEWIIIVLIMIEVVLALATKFELFPK
ncbi:MAG: RMD1 family protein [Janthinobacterium lividum]